MVDMVVKRQDLHATIGQLLNLLMDKDGKTYSQTKDAEKTEGSAGKNDKKAKKSSIAKAASQSAKRAQTATKEGKPDTEPEKRVPKRIKSAA